MSERLLRCIFGRGFFATVIKKFDDLVRIITIRIMAKKIDVDEKKVIFLNFSGNYDCNPKYICEELIKRYPDMHFVWGVNKKTRIGPDFFPVQVKTVVRGKADFYAELCSAKIIIDNGISTAFLHYRKKPNQYLIETWHGSLGIKKFGRSSNKDTKWLKTAAVEGKMTDFIISNSSFEDEIYREDFWKDTKIWQFGHARNDILLNHDADTVKRIREELYEEYEIPKDVKLCMYAPTFRDSNDLLEYTLDYEQMTKALEERFGGKWAIMTRFHARTVKKMGQYRLPKNVYNVSKYIDVQELMIVIDAGITDYSSWICEYMLRRKPGFMFATDLEDYKDKERELFFPLTDLPFPVASCESELFQNIREFSNEKFVERCNEFLADKGSIDDGHAAERIATEIGKLLKI